MDGLVPWQISVRGKDLKNVIPVRIFCEATKDEVRNY